MDEVAAEARQGLRVAGVAVLAGARARLALEGLAGLLHLHRRDELALRPALERRAGEGVVDPVGDEHAPQAEAAQLAEPRVDVGLRALRDAELLGAAEGVG